ncbi:MAG: LamG-like jellyroll fold domain-containing protein, partial [Planctomycetota bacterium]
MPELLGLRAGILSHGKRTPDRLNCFVVQRPLDGKRSDASRAAGERRLITLIAGAVLMLWTPTVRATDDVAKVDESQSLRSTEGLLVFYNFADTDGAIVRDRSGAQKPLDLRIQHPNRVVRRAGELEIRNKTLIRSLRPATDLVRAIQTSGATTVETWITPHDTKQTGPARIVTLSKDSVRRNFTVGQERNRYDARFRSDKTSDNGLPSLATSGKTVRASLTHLVFTRSKRGITKFFVDGKQVQNGRTDGSLSSWADGMHLAIGDEMTGSRPWLGKLHLLAIYDRALGSDDVRRHHAAGANGRQGKATEDVAIDPRQQHFEQRVAPVLAKHCLECHDALLNEGGLDLSHRVAALQGGDSGLAFTPGSAQDSLLWQAIESDEMPLGRSPMTAKEKKIVRQWLDDGATWTLPMIDPAVYVHGGDANENWLRRLTVTEYIETVRAIFGIDVGDDARRILPPDVRADGFSNTAYTLTVDLSHVEAYQRLAEIIVAKIDATAFAKRFAKKLSFTDADMKNLITEMGERVLRGPLRDDEIVALRGIASTIAATENAELDEAIA